MQVGEKSVGEGVCVQENVGSGWNVVRLWVCAYVCVCVCVGGYRGHMGVLPSVKRAPLQGLSSCPDSLNVTVN